MQRRKIAVLVILHTCLSIGKNASIVSLKSIVKYIVSKTLEDIFLASEMRVVGIHRVKTVIKSEAFGLFSTEIESKGM